MASLIDYIARIIALCRKELLTLLKDPSSRAILFAPALMQSLLFGYGATCDRPTLRSRCSTRAGARPRRSCWPGGLPPSGGPVLI